jgi:hypothetical protein
MLLVAVLSVGAVAVAATPPPPRGLVNAVCPTRTFNVAFDPTRQVIVTAGERPLASATFSRRAISGRCRRVREPGAVVSGRLGAGIYARTAFRCMATKPIRIRTHAIVNGDTGGIAGSVLLVGIGSPRFRVIVSAVLKNKGDPKASRIYRAAAYCKPGA